MFCRQAYNIMISITTIKISLYYIVDVIPLLFSKLSMPTFILEPHSWQEFASSIQTIPHEIQNISCNYFAAETFYILVATAYSTCSNFTLISAITI